MLHAAPVLLTIGVLWSAAVVAPGPNFVITTRSALLGSREAGVRTALGIAGGAAVWGVSGFFGVHALFALAPWLYLGLKFGGSFYLVLLGAKYVRNSFRPVMTAASLVPPTPRGSAIRLGFLTSIANPQSALSTVRPARASRRSRYAGC
jgi:threonine/homoserine/homoserine lactone efflux protein